MDKDLFKDYLEIVKCNVPLIDVRSKIEYEKGSFRNSKNIPILNNEERHLVGKAYKEQGKEEAISLGYELTKENKNEKLSKWKEFIDIHQRVLIYCHRGGLRSQISQEWIYEALDKKVLRIEGGFKAFRNFLIDSLKSENQNYTPIRLGGCTGSGKTILLNQLENTIDLEGLANHRGSIFGPQITPQPSQIDFENALAYEIINKQKLNYKHLIFEDEGKHVGKSYLPRDYYQFLAKGKLIILEVDFNKRVENILDEYVIKSQQEYVDNYDDMGMGIWLSYIKQSIEKARSRLGSQKYLKLIELVDEALKKQNRNGDPHSHCSWIEFFLKYYYDPMYEYQISKNEGKIIYSGNFDQVKKYILSLG